MVRKFVCRWRPVYGLVVLASLVAGIAAAEDRPAGKFPADPDRVFSAERERSPQTASGGDGVPPKSADEPRRNRVVPAGLFQNAQPAPLPPAPEPFVPTPRSPEAARDLHTSVFGTRDASLSLLSRARQAQARGIAGDFIIGAESKFRATTDTGSLLRKSAATPGVASQSRSPIVTDPRVRGSQVGQLIASGSYWFPARQDVDTILSKIDSRIISDVIVVKGPYAARYGPGFDFVDVELLPSPRFAGGYETHGSSSMEYKSNGEQFYGRQTFWGGSDNFGFRIGYGHRIGNDYVDGNDRNYISSYNSRDWDVAFGYDLSKDSHVEFNYLRLDQKPVEFPGQLIDIDFLVTDGFKLAWILENQKYFDVMTLEGWYNQTRMEGNANSEGKRAQIPLLALNNFTINSDSRNSSAGFSLTFGWGTFEEQQTTAGFDLRYLTQEINQFTTSDFFPPPNFFGNNATPQVNGPLPRSHSANPGIFLEHTRRASDRLRLTAGGRVDLVDTNAEQVVDEVEGSSGFNGVVYNPNGLPVQVAPGVFIPFPAANLEDVLGGRFNQSFTLGSAYLTGEYKLDDHWTAVTGGAFAMRPPTMMQLYSFQVLSTVMPQITAAILNGDPNLKSEKRYQIDAGLNADYGKFRGGFRGYHAWINDYITFDQILPDFLFYNYVNTDLATLAGFDLYGQYDATENLTAFASVNYVEGRDHTRSGNGVSAAVFGRPDADPRSGVSTPEEPLPVIAPLEARLGLRLHEGSPAPRWGVEFLTRVVNRQDRVASSLSELPTPGFTTFDLRVFWRPTKSLTIVAGVENLTDKTYQEHFDARGRVLQVPAFLAGRVSAFGSSGVAFRPGANYYLGTELVY